MRQVLCLRRTLVGSAENGGDEAAEETDLSFNFLLRPASHRELMIDDNENDKKKTCYHLYVEISMKTKFSS